MSKSAPVYGSVFLLLRSVIMSFPSGIISSWSLKWSIISEIWNHLQAGNVSSAECRDMDLLINSTFTSFEIVPYKLYERKYLRLFAADGWNVKHCKRFDELIQDIMFTLQSNHIYGTKEIWEIVPKTLEVQQSIKLVWITNKRSGTFYIEKHSCYR